VARVRAKVWFLGGGPGAPDLLTVRAARILTEADIVIWGQSLLSEAAVTEYASEAADLIPWPPAKMPDIYAAYERAAREELVVARLYWGDPAIYGAVRAEAHEARSRGLPVEVVPGVSALGAAAAALVRELTAAPEDPPPLILTTPRKDPLPNQRIRDLASHGATMALFMAGKRGEDLQTELLAGGFDADTPCAVAHRVTWPDEVVLTCRLGDLAHTMDDPELERHTLVLVGPALDGESEAG
jgi:precorrin-4/cobalt-precorrin-4 C11-methyltransferase